MSTSVQTRPTLSPALPGVTAAGEAGGTGLLAIYALTMLVSATLLFFVQPMFARMVLPLLGGSPGVWNTTVVFYQAVLLGGYCYAHAATARLGVRRQAGLHVLLLLLPLLALPIAVPAGWIPPTGETPIPWLLALLTIAVGLPFFVVSTSSPMLQRWFVSSGHPAAPDPYFLYAASNVGSMLALLSYPVLVEPSLRLTEQSWLWAAGYGLLGGLTALCVLTVWRSPLTKAAPAIVSTTVADAPSGRRRLRWVMLAFVPSSLMLSVTTYLTTNIAPIPLLWVVPLALYLLTFILVFAGRQILPDRLLIRAMPIAILLLAIIMIVQASQPISLPIALNLATFFIVAMVCHGAIARDRPDSRHLTEFYIWMSVGGVLGGLLNALAAPVLFSGVAEYPIVLVLACLLMPSITPPLAPGRRWLDFGLALGLAALTAGLIFGTAALGLRSGPLGIALTFGPPVLLCFGFSRRPLRFGLGLAGLFLASMLYSSDQASVIHAERSFFGIHRVLADPGDRFHMIVHGGTVHGLQSTEPARRREPLAYYQRSGPIGQVFASGPAPWPVTVSLASAGPSTRSTRASSASPATRATSPISRTAPRRRASSSATPASPWSGRRTGPTT
jgi:hypothetical protein